ncbi:MAG: SEC-C domain-containing protein [Thermoanaerobaculia bacterium]|nr:SEC-C domain-containing protein [Thermoanaerobaculia bacterium]
MSIGRNDPCPCGSGRKYKRCCLGKGDPEVQARNRKFIVLTALVLAAGLACGIFISREVGILVSGVGLAVVAVAVWLSTPPPKSSGGADPSAINFGR